MRKIRVLIADDIGAVRAVVRNLLVSLEVSEMTISEAPDGATALQIIRDENPELVITDWNMPDASGIDVLKAVRQQSSTVPVLMLTSNNRRSEVIDAARAGATDYILKPFSRPQLVAKLSHWIRQIESSSTTDLQAAEAAMRQRAAEMPDDGE